MVGWHEFSRRPSLTADKSLRHKLGSSPRPGAARPLLRPVLELDASATDTQNDTGTTYIIVTAAQPVVSFTEPTNGQQIVTFTNLAIAAQTEAGTIQQVTFSIYNQSGQSWNGTNFQDTPVSLPTSLLEPV